MPAREGCEGSHGAHGSQRGAEPSAVVVAVYHASDEVDRHLEPLRQSSRLSIARFSQRSGSFRVSAAGFDAVLWELTPDRPLDRRRLAALARRVPVVSYSAEAWLSASTISRRCGFRAHLLAPLSAEAVERQVKGTERADLGARLRDVVPALRQHLQRPDLLAAVVTAVNASVEPAKVAAAILTQFSGWIPAPAYALVVADLGGDLQVSAGCNVPEELEPVLAQIADWVMRHAQTFASANLHADARLAAGPEMSVLALPLSGRQPMGALVAFDHLSSSKEPALPAAAQDVILRLLEPAAIALDNAMRLERAEALSVTDDLTHLYNSRYLNQVLRRESKRAGRSGRPLSVLFIDLDGFKSVNDRHGHLAGSRTLAETASVLRDSARETDVVARYGGDEFAMVLPETHAPGALLVARRVRQRLCEHHFLASEGLDIRLTASVGVATLPDVAGTAEELLQAADTAMYRVKERGKDGIEVATLPNGN